MLCSVCVCMCACIVVGRAELRACLQSVCLRADRSILNHAAVNLPKHSDNNIQTTGRKNSLLCPSRLLHIYLQLLTQHRLIILHPAPSSLRIHIHVQAVLRVHGVHMGLDMKSECNVSDHRASGDQVLLCCNSFQFRFQVP